MVFLYTINKHTEKEIMNVSFHNSVRENKLSKNKCKQATDKTSIMKTINLWRKIEKNIRKWKVTSFSWKDRINIIKMAIPLLTFVQFMSLVQTCNSYKQHFDEAYNLFFICLVILVGHKYPFIFKVVVHKQDCHFRMVFWLSCVFSFSSFLSMLFAFCRNFLCFGSV